MLVLSGVGYMLLCFHSSVQLSILGSLRKTTSSSFQFNPLHLCFLKLVVCVCVVYVQISFLSAQVMET